MDQDEGIRSLFEPLTIRGMSLANRAVMPAMGTFLGNRDSTVSEAVIAYLERRARGRPGLIVTEIVGVDPEGLCLDSQLGAFDDRFIPGLRRLAAASHTHGCKIALQLHHAGRESLYLLLRGQARGPSALPSLVYGLPPKAMTREDIDEVTIAFARAALRAREAGFDAVEIHAAHGYLLTQFLSPIANRRTDDYGGSAINRARFPLKVVRAVRAAVGEDFPISLRLSMDECLKGGYGKGDMQALLPHFAEAGADIIHASFGTHGSPGGITCAPPEYAPGFQAHLARAAKDAVDLPVIAVGRFTDPEAAGAVIARGDADLVAFGRQFLADPDFLLKTRSGRAHEIRTCIACNQGCIERLVLGEGSVRCAINPETGQELLYPSSPAASPKEVWIAGAGPAGLSAAYEACRLGHKVTVFERETQLGGQVRFGGRPPFKEAYARWIEWLSDQVRALGGRIVTGTSLGADLEHPPPAVIVATGGVMIVPAIVGLDLPHVSDAWQVLAGEVAPGHAVVVIGGGMVGMETADFLCARGAQVTVVEMLPSSPVQPVTSHGYMLHRRLREAGAVLRFGTCVRAITPEGVRVETDGAEDLLAPVDQVVLAVGLRADPCLAEALHERGVACTLVGDAREPRRIIEATDEGAKAVWAL